VSSELEKPTSVSQPMLNDVESNVLTSPLRQPSPASLHLPLPGEHCPSQPRVRVLKYARRRMLPL